MQKKTSRIISLFNHKGGVSKTTTTFNLGWMLAQKGYKVLLVDADPQCNLTGLILGYSGNEDFEKFYTKNPDINLKAALRPAYESLPKLIEPIEPVKVKKNKNLFLIPGHINLSEYEITLGIAQELSSSIQALKNIPGALSYFIKKEIEAYGFDFVLVDMNPSLGSLNQNILMSSDYFIVPTAPDFFSKMAIDSLNEVFPRWQKWSEKAQGLVDLEKAAYPFPKGFPKFLGTVIQKYRPRNGEATEGFQAWIDKINEAVSDRFVPAIEKIDMLLTHEQYKSVDKGLTKNYCLVQIPDFNTLIATSQQYKTPVFALKDSMFGHVGAVLKQDQKKRDEFLGIFSRLADEVIELTNA
ncbi:AAA family ATPase [Chitinophaga sp.]|uniref:ParA family protein n=1 Tax=Chitinophaga sp. TaxID=1869181 RepID=UPI0031D2D501